MWFNSFNTPLALGRSQISVNKNYDQYNLALNKKHGARIRKKWKTDFFSKILAQD